MNTGRRLPHRQPDLWWSFVGLRRTVSLVVLTVLVSLPHAVQASDLYCGEQDCYELLKVERTATASEIKKAFYKISLVLHPDKNKAPDAESRYREIVNAYDVLSDPVSRGDYDSMLQNPDQFFTNQFRYYRFRAGMHHTALWKVVVGFLSFCTVSHYLYWYHRYYRLHELVKNMPQVQARMKANVLGRQPAGKKLEKRELEKLIEAEDVSQYIEISGWEGRLPTWRDLLVISLLIHYPWAVAKYFWWWGRWLVKFRLLQHPYGPEELEYITAGALGLEWARWMRIPENERAEMLSRKLWLRDNLRDFLREYKDKHRPQRKWR